MNDKRGRLSWFRWFVDDFLGGVQTFSAEQVGQYTLLLSAQFSSKEEKGVPNDPEQLRTICRGAPSPAVLAKFEKVGKLLRNGRMAKEWDNCVAEYGARVRGAQHSAQRRAQRSAQRSAQHGAEHDADGGAEPHTTTTTTTTTLTPTAKNGDSSRETRDKSKAADLAAKVQTVFDYWRRVCEHSAAKLTPERKQKIIARLGQGYSVADLKTAIDGCKASAFHQGDNKEGRKYDDLTLIMRNGSKVEDFMRHVGQVDRRSREEREIDQWAEEALGGEDGSQAVRGGDEGAGGAAERGGHVDLESRDGVFQRTKDPKR